MSHNMTWFIEVEYRCEEVEGEGEKRFKKDGFILLIIVKFVNAEERIFIVN